MEFTISPLMFVILGAPTQTSYVLDPQDNASRLSSKMPMYIRLARRRNFLEDTHVTDSSSSSQKKEWILAIGRFEHVSNNVCDVLAKIHKSQNIQLRFSRLITWDSCFCKCCCQVCRLHPHGESMLRGVGILILPCTNTLCPNSYSSLWHCFLWLAKSALTTFVFVARPL